MKRCLNKRKCKILWLLKLHVAGHLAQGLLLSTIIITSSNNPYRNYDLLLSTKSSLGDFSPSLEEFLFTQKKKFRVSFFRHCSSGGSEAVWLSAKVLVGVGVGVGRHGGGGPRL